jgi:hypothetical protein
MKAESHNIETGRYGQYINLAKQEINIHVPENNNR